MSIQEIIEEKIRRAGKTKTSVCADIGINSGNLNRMLSSPSWPTLERIAGALGLSVAALITSPEEARSLLQAGASLIEVAQGIPGKPRRTAKSLLKAIDQPIQTP